MKKPRVSASGSAWTPVSPSVLWVSMGQGCTSLPCSLQGICQHCLCPVPAPAAPLLSRYVSPVLVWRKWGHCYSSRAPPESITGHCSRECLASVKPCQGGYKAFLKSSESISTFCPPATSNSNSSCFQANSKANEALVPGLGGAVMTFTCCSSEGLAGRSWSSQVSRLGNTGCLWVSPSIPKFCMHWRFYERAWR